MGDRANVVVLESDEQRQGKTAVFLYTHWTGSNLPAVLKRAIDRAPDRWGDASYLARNIFSEMTRGSEEDTTGYAIGLALIDNQHPLLVVDVPGQQVIEYDEDEYIESGFANLPKKGRAFAKYSGKWGRTRRTAP